MSLLNEAMERQRRAVALKHIHKALLASSDISDRLTVQTEKLRRDVMELLCVQTYGTMEAVENSALLVMAGAAAIYVNCIRGK